MIIQAWSQAK